MQTLEPLADTGEPVRGSIGLTLDAAAVAHMLSQMRMKETGPEAILPVVRARVPYGRRVEKS
ncbi:MAG: hypothetical protein V3R62_01210 [Acidiferrobacterales bacterium]